MVSLSQIRIAEISIAHLKNVGCGRVKLINEQYLCSMLGLYGPNGSGKSTLINALEILQYALTGKALPERFKYYIQQGYPAAELTFKFQIKADSSSCISEVTYSFKIGAASAAGSEEQSKLPSILNEAITYLSRAPTKDAKARSRKLAAVTADLELKPKALRDTLNAYLGNKQELAANFMLCRSCGKSCLFNAYFLKLIGAVKDSADCAAEKLYDLAAALSALNNFGRFSLFIISSSAFQHNQQPPLLPVLFTADENAENNAALNEALLNLMSSEVCLPVTAAERFERQITAVSMVLKNLVPGLKLETERCVEPACHNKADLCRYRLYAVRNGVKLPLYYEAEGIKRIISILQLLIYAFGSKNITAVIDDLDTGIFEHLLGLLLQEFSLGAKGQLIFTAHNLRPLEMLDRSLIAFTTINEKRRYRSLARVKAVNLRDLYYTKIYTEDGADALYDGSGDGGIVLAFAQACQAAAVKP